MRSKSQAALLGVAACTLAAALLLLVVPPWFTSAYYVPHIVFLLFFGALRLFIPMMIFVSVRERLPLPAGGETRLARLSGWACVCMASAGMLWMSDGGEGVLELMNPGVRDLPWYSLLAANELARHGVHRRSRTLGALAFAALGLGIGLAAALGTLSMEVDALHGDILRGLGWAYKVIATHPWIAMIWLAGLWTWVALEDRHRPREAGNTPKAAGAGCAD